MLYKELQENEMETNKNIRAVECGDCNTCGKCGSAECPEGLTFYTMIIYS